MTSLFADTLQHTLGDAYRVDRELGGGGMSRVFVAGADTIRAATDHCMRSGSRTLVSVVAINRMVIARALRKRGKPEEAERYLMWTDAVANSVRNLGLRLALGPLVSYERGVAFDEARDARAAAYRLQRFVDAYDQPPAAHRALVDDARKRLATLERTDAPATRAVAPR